MKKLWIEALTSGEYEQGRNALRKGDAYCCLGVLCDLHRKESRRRWRLGHHWFKYGGEPTGLPEFVTDWAGLPARPYPVLANGSNLADLNDKGTPFPEIAKLIEQHL